MTIPTPPSGQNAACLTASGNSATLPLLSCAGATDAQGSGKLRFTSATLNQVGGVFGQISFPTSNGLDVTFTSYQWGGTGADGLGFMLAAVDPANPAAPTAIGSSGGALGYSAAPGVVGLTNAYLGVGLDVFGNFSSTSYSGTGCSTVAAISTRTPGAAVVRGPGNAKVGYCGLTTTSDGTSGSTLTLRAVTRAASAVPVQVLINPTSSALTSDSGVAVSAGTYKVVLTPIGQSTRTLSGALPAATGLYPSASWLSPSGVPKQLAFGFVGSTGSVSDAHEISNAKVLTFNPVPQLAVSSTGYSTAAPQPGDPATYTAAASVLAGANETSPVSVTQTVPAGVVPVGAYGTGWDCQAPVGKTVTCTTTASSIANGTALPVITVVAVVNGSGVTSTLVQTASTARASSADASPGADSTTTAGTLPTAPSAITVTPAIGPVGGGGAVTVGGTAIAAATAIEIGTTAEQQAGTPVTLLPCAGAAAPGCFTVSGGNLVISSMPARVASATVSVTVVTAGVAAAASYIYAAALTIPATPTATAGITSATLAWTAPAANGSPITGYVVTPYLAGVAQAQQTFDASTTTRTFTGLTAAASYTFTVAAVNAFGTSAASPKSAAVVPYALPAAPTITAATAGSLAATLTWTTPANGGSAITGYVVTPYLGTVAQAAQTFTGTATTATVTGLTAGTAYTFTVAAQNLAGTGPASAASSPVTPNQSPSLTFSAPPGGEVGVAYSTQLAATGGTSPFVWSVSGGTLPAGLTLAPSTGLLAGTPTAAGSFPVTIRVVDASSQAATKAVTLVIAATPALTFAPPAGEVGVPYSQQPTLTGGTGPFTWAVSAGSLPVGLALDRSTGLVSGATTTVGTVGFAGSTLTWTGDLGVGQTAVITYGVTIANPDLGDKAMVNSAESNELGSSCPTDATLPSCTTFVTVLVPVLDIAVTADRTTTTPGATVGYTVTVRNAGQTDYVGAGVTTRLAGVLDDAAAGSATATTGTVTAAGSDLTWTGDLAAGATATITYSVTVADPDSGDHVLTTTTGSSAPGSTCGVAAQCTNTVTVLIPGLSVSTVADVATATPGDQVVFTIRAANTGQTSYLGTAVGTSLTRVLDDAGFDGQVRASAGVASYTAPDLSWTGSLLPGATATISYTVTVTSPDPGDKLLSTTAVAPAPGSTCATGSSDAACTAAVTVLIPGLAITSAAAPTTTPGAVVSYTVVVTNTGQTAYTGAVVENSLAGVLPDADYNGDAAVVGGGTLAFAGSTLSWTGDLPIGAAATLTFSVTVHDPDTGDKQMLSTVASPTAGSTCPRGGALLACSALVRVEVPALVAALTADTTTVTAGGVVRYTVTVANTGETDYTPATVTDPLSGLLDDADYAGDATTDVGTVTYADQTLVWTGPLAVGSTATFAYSVTTRYPATGDLTLTNTASSTSAGANCSTATDPRCSATVTVLVPELTITQTADTSEVVAGGTVAYTISATNTGQADLPLATFSASLAGVLDDGTYDDDATATSGVVGYANGVLSWTGSLGRGASVLVGYSVTASTVGTGDAILTNRVVSATLGSTCTATSGPPCTTSITVAARAITLTDLTSSFLLTGLPNSTDSTIGTVTMTVTTNSATGYTVTVLGMSSSLAGAAPGNTATIPIDRLGVRETGTTAFQPLSADTPVVVHQQGAPSAPGGDAVSNDYQVQIPDVASYTYSATLDYIVSAQ